MLIAIRTINAANPFFRTQDCTTTGTLIKDHSGIWRHLLVPGKSTLRTSDDGIQFYFHNHNSPLRSTLLKALVVGKGLNTILTKYCLIGMFMNCWHYEFRA